MTSMLLVVVVHYLATPAPAVPRANVSPSIYALVYIGEEPKWWPRHLHQRTKITELNEAVLEAALRADGVAELKVVKLQQHRKTWAKGDGTAWLKKHLRAESLDGTNVIRITFDDGSPQEQVSLINAIAKAYLDALIERERKQVRGMLSDGKEGVAQSLRDIVAWEKEITALRRMKIEDKADAEAVESQMKVWIRPIRDAHNKIKRMEARQLELERQLRNPSILLIERAHEPPPPLPR